MKFTTRAGCVWHAIPHHTCCHRVYSTDFVLSEGPSSSRVFCCMLQALFQSKTVSRFLFSFNESIQIVSGFLLLPQVCQKHIHAWLCLARRKHFNWFFLKSKRFQHNESNLLRVNEELCTMPMSLFFVVSLLIGIFFVNVLYLKWREGKS